MTRKFLFKLQLQGPDFTREVILNQGITSLGRDPGNDIHLAFPKISRKHAIFESLEAVCLLQDLGSANGTLVNGKRLEPNIPTPINDESEILVDVISIRLKTEVVDVPDRPLNEPTQDTVSKARALEQAQIRQAEGEGTKSAGMVEAPVVEPVELPAEPVVSEPAEKKEKQRAPVKRQEPPIPPSQPPREPDIREQPVFEEPDRQAIIPPGLSIDSVRLLDYLPSIYHTEFMSHFMALFESILLPLEWNIDNFDLFLSPRTAPFQFLPWLSDWYEIVFDSSWPEEKRRLLLTEAHEIYARRGTRWSLSRLLEIYTGQTPQIFEFEKDLEPHTFKVVLKADPALDRALLIRLINANKPTHTSYRLEMTGN